MNKIVLAHNNEKSEVIAQVEKIKENQVTVIVNDIKYLLQLNLGADGSACAKDLTTNTIIPFYYLLKDDKIELWLNGKTYIIKKLDTKKKTIQNISSSQPMTSSGIIRAPMPGMILKILTETGANVKANVPLVIMESMKMELTITSPLDGIVTDIDCTIGQMVEMQAVLIKLEKEEMFEKVEEN